MEGGNINASPILYKQGDNREGILILHGFGVDIANTDMLFNYFSGKGYTVARPVLLGHNGSKTAMLKYGPEDWLNEARLWLEKLSETVDKVYIFGISFGSNLAVSLSTEKHSKLKGLVLSEMPIFFNLKISLILNVLQPIFEFFKIDFIRKDGPFYRKNHVKREGAFEFVPVKTAGLIRKYIKKRTKRELSKVGLPVFLIQAQKSDLVNNNRVKRYICERVDEKNMKFYCVPINNHDLNILDDAGKVIVLEKINQFVKSLK